MPCESRGGVVMCSRRPQTRCHVCGKPMVALCDATRKDGRPCDLPMCEEHRHRVGEDTDVCKYHNYPKYVRTAIENRKRMEEVENYFRERYAKASFSVVPGHWPDFKTKAEVDEWIEHHEAMMQYPKNNEANKNEPKEPIMANDTCGLGDVVYQVPSCPTCKEPTYGMDRCPFCGQKFTQY